MVVTVLRQTLQRAMPLMLLCLMLLASTCHGDIDPPPKTAAPPASSDDAPRTVVAAVRAAIAQGRSEFTAGNTSAAERTLLAAGAALSWADQMAHPALTVVLFSELASLYTRQNECVSSSGFTHAITCLLRGVRWLPARSEDRAWFALQHALQGMTNTVDSDIAVLRGLAYTSEVVQAMIRLHATLGNQRRRAFSLRHFGTAGPPGVQQLCGVGIVLLSHPRGVLLLLHVLPARMAHSRVARVCQHGLTRGPAPTRVPRFLGPALRSSQSAQITTPP